MAYFEKEEKKKPWWLILTGIFLFILIIVIIVLAWPKGSKTTKGTESGKTEENTVVEVKPLPFVEDKNIEVLSANTVYSAPAYVYAYNENNEYITSGVTFDAASTTYKFYDYSTSEEDENGYVTMSFKCDKITNISYLQSDNNLGKWKYSVSSMGVSLFDYYTGDDYHFVTNSEDASFISLIDGKISSENQNQMQYTNITWDGKTYKIGIFSSTKGGWTGNENLGNNKYKDTSYETQTFYVYAPKDYKIMIAIVKAGSTKESFTKNMEFYNKYTKLQEEALKTGEKSAELIKIEEQRNRRITILESIIDVNKRYTKDDFYVVKATDIAPSVKEVE